MPDGWYQYNVTKPFLTHFKLNDCEYKQDFDWGADEVDDEDDESDGKRSYGEQWLGA